MEETLTLVSDYRIRSHSCMNIIDDVTMRLEYVPKLK